MPELYPLRFQPIYKDYVWGGEKIIRLFSRADAGLPRYAESWEVSDRPEGMSVVVNGSLAGKSLRELCDQYGAALVGTTSLPPAFPLLIKLIDARETLSVQVHPDDRAARLHGGEAKSEMWYVLQADPGAFIYRGFNGDVRQSDFETALRDGKIAGLLKKIEVKAGDEVYVPGGCVHAIGAGCLLLEIQQNSNTTYRIHDWNRVGPDGQPRELHLAQALKVIQWGPTEIQRPERSPYFRFDTRAVRGRTTRKQDGRSFEVLFVESGALVVDGVSAHAGDSVLVPAGLASYTTEGDARICAISLP